MTTLPTKLAANCRVRAMLLAVAEGRAEITLGREPDLYVDGLPCSDQCTAHAMARDGLIRPTRPGLIGQRVPAALTAAGEATLAATPVSQLAAGQ